MGARNSQEKNVVFYKLKSKADATNTPHFSKVEKVGDSWQETDTFNELFGVIKGVELKESEHNGKKYKILSLKITDQSENSILQMPFTNVTYSIVNCLINEFDINDEISLTLVKTKSTANGKDYYNASCYVNQDGEMVKWSIDIKETPRPELILGKDGEPLLVNGDKVYDKTKVEQYWVDKIENILIPKFKNASSEENKIIQDASPFEITTEFNEKEHDDLPF